MKRRFAVATLSLLVALFGLWGEAFSAQSQGSQEVTRAEEQRLQRSSRLELQNAIARTFRYHNRRVSVAQAQEYASYVIEAASYYSVDPALIAALIIKESRVKPNARSKYAVGLMQIYWRLHRKSIQSQFPHIKTEADVMAPRNNVFVGTWLFAGYLRSSRGDVRKALTRYLGKQSERYISAVQGYRRQVMDQIQ